MTLPANIRVNVSVPFPALVQGNAPIALTKQNGVWSISLDTIDLTTNAPAPANYVTDFVIVYDQLAKQYFKVSLSSLSGVSARTQRSLTGSSGSAALLATDMILNCNFTAATAIALPAAATRNGVPLTFKDVGAQFQNNNLTLNPNGAETIDGAANLVLKVNRQAVTLWPFTDGVNTGWFID